MFDSTITRRRFIRNGGLSSAVALSGCLRLTSNATEAPPKGTEKDQKGDENIGVSTGTPQTESVSTEGVKTGEFRAVSTVKSDWAIAAGEWEFREGFIQQNSSEINQVIFAEDINLTDGEFVADITSLDGRYGHHLVWRGDGKYRSNYYFFGVILNREHPPENFVKWGYIEDGTPSTGERIPFADTPVDISKGQSHTFRVRFINDTHEMWIDDHRLFSVGDQTHHSGAIGFHCGARTRFQKIQYRNL